MAATQRSTPQTLRSLIALLWAADLILLAVCFAAAGLQRAGLQTVTRDSAPSIVAAQRIKAALADMDAQAANTLLSAPGHDEVPLRVFELRRQEAAASLIDAAENITFGNAEREPIHALQLGLGSYEAVVQRARDLYDRREPGYLAAYQQAAQVMDFVLMRAADQLNDANESAMNSSYESEKQKTVMTRGGTVAGGFLFLYVLLAAQVYLSRRTNRTLNLPLLAATCLAVAWSSWAFATLTSEQWQLRRAKEEAFTSVRALWRAKAAAYSAESAESRFLLDRPHAAQHEASFSKSAALLLDLPADVPVSQFAQTVQRSRRVSGASGLLVDEIENTKVPSEREAALQAILNFGEYLRLDKEMRRQERSGRHSEAITFLGGDGKGDVHSALLDMDRSLQAALTPNQRMFDDAVAEAFRSLEHFEQRATLFAVVIALLVFAGLMQRIAEYR